MEFYEQIIKVQVSLLIGIAGNAIQQRGSKILRGKSEISTRYPVQRICEMKTVCSTDLDNFRVVEFFHSNNTGQINLRVGLFISKQFVILDETQLITSV